MPVSYNTLLNHPTRVICVHLASITNRNHRAYQVRFTPLRYAGINAINGDIVRAVFRSLPNGRLEQQPYQERSKTLELGKACRMACFDLQTCTGQ